MSTPPQYVVTLTPPGGTGQTITGNFDQDRWMMQETFGRTGTQATFYLQDEIEDGGAPHIMVPPLSRLSITDTVAGSVFAGVVMKPAWWYRAPNLVTWELTCTDYTVYAQNAIVHGDFLGYSADEVIVALTQQAACGINAAKVADGGFVFPAPVVPYMRLNYSQLSAAWSNVSKQASVGESYGWYVDDALNLHFYNPSQASLGPVTITDDVTAEGSTTLAHIQVDQQFRYYWDGSNARTRCLVRGITQTVPAGSPKSSPPTDSWVGNGSTATFTLAYGLQTTSVSIVVLEDGASKTVGIAGQSGGQYVVGQNQQNGNFTLTRQAGPLPRGSRLQAWYSHQVQITAQADDLAAQQALTGPNGGVFAMYVADTSLATASAAFQRGLRELVEYARPQELLHATLSPGFLGIVHAGDIVTATLTRVPDSLNGFALGFTAPFICTTAMLTGVPGGYREYACDFVRIG